MEAILKLYKNAICTNEIEKDTNGDYTIDLHLLSSNNTSSFVKQLYVKNAGTHKAYRISVIELTDSLNKINISINKTILNIEEIAVITLTMPIVQGENKDGTFSFRLNYDNL